MSLRNLCQANSEETIKQGTELNAIHCVYSR